jgi:hypothetical protein
VESRREKKNLKKINIELQKLVIFSLLVIAEEIELKVLGGSEKLGRSGRVRDYNGELEPFVASKQVHHGLGLVIHGGR